MLVIGIMTTFRDETNLKIVDSHVHFWDLELLEYKWLLQESAIRRTYLPSDFFEAASGCKIHKLLFVQADCLPSQGLNEVEWVTELSVAEKRIAGIIAHAPVENELLLNSTLESLSRMELVCGIRRILQSEVLGFGTQTAFIEGVQNLERFGFTFDICVHHTQLADMVELVSRCPGVNFILDHLGKPDIKSQKFQPWKDNIANLSECANVYCKLSGLATEADMDAWRTSDFVPYIEHALECFGTQRVMFGGDWPVSTLAITYQQWYEVLLDCLSHLDQSELDCIFRRNAEAVYRI